MCPAGLRSEIDRPGPGGGSLYPVWIVAILASSVLVGCVGPEAPGSPGVGSSLEVEIATPQNSSYAYEAVEGDARLTVEPNGTALRVGPGLEVHEAVRLSFVYDDGQKSDSFVFHEFVDAASGLLVQQQANCGILRGGPGNWSCWDERGIVLTSAAGLPAGFGAGPFWNETIDAGGATVELASFLSNRTRLRYQVSDARGFPGKPCVSLTPERGPPRARALRFTGGLRSLILCDGLGMPRAFETFSGARYRLEERTGTSDFWPDASTRSAVPAWGQGVPLRDRTPPNVLAHRDVETNFSVAEADRVASNRSQAYADLRSKGGWLVGTHWSHRETSRSTVRSSDTFQRTLTVVGPDGRTMGIRIEKTESEAGAGPVGQSERSYEILEQGTARWDRPVPMEGGYSLRQADASEAISLGRSLTGQPLDELGFGFWTHLSGHTWQGNTSEPRRADGYTLVIWHKDPTSFTQTVSSPYSTVVDGPTGNLMWVKTNRSRFPLTDEVR